MAFSIRLNDEEKAIAYSYAEMHSISVGEAFKSALFEKIEDEYDIAVANEAMKEYVESGYNSIPFEEIEKELGL